MRLRAHIKPNSKHDESVALIDGVYHIRIKAPAIDGRANQRAIELLAAFFVKPKSSVRLVSGRSARDKTFEID